MRIAVAFFIASTVSLGFAFHEQAVSADCHSLKLMTRMARIVAWEHQDIVASEMRRVCDANDVQQTRAWRDPGPGRMKSKGTWHYPANGNRAIDGQGLFYPAQSNAKVGENWYYPRGGGQAKGRTTWYRQRKATTEQALREWACKQIPREQCTRAQTDIDTASGDERVLAIIELAWLAHNAAQK